MANFEGKESRMPKIKETLAKYNFSSLEEARELTNKKGIDVEQEVRSVQPIVYENAIWAYILGIGIALRKNSREPEIAAISIGEGLQAFTVPGSVAEQRKVGRGHGELAARLLNEETRVFAFVAGHESFPAAEGAAGIARYANKVRKQPLRIVVHGLGKNAAQIIARLRGYTFIETKYDFLSQRLKIVYKKKYTQGENSRIRVYGASSVEEGIEIMKHEKVDVVITGNSTNIVRFTQPVVGTYKKWCLENGRKLFGIGSGGGTGRTLHPDNMAAGPCSFGLTDTMGRMWCDVQFAGSSSVPAHVHIMGFIGMANNPIVGATVALAARVSMGLSSKSK